MTECMKYYQNIINLFHYPKILLLILLTVALHNICLYWWRMNAQNWFLPARNLMRWIETSFIILNNGKGVNVLDRVLSTGKPVIARSIFHCRRLHPHTMKGRRMDV
jgi:hypothetical protein